MGAWPEDATLERHYDLYGDPERVLYPAGLVTTGDLGGLAITRDDLGRPTSFVEALPGGALGPESGLGSTIGWAGTARVLQVATRGPRAFTSTLAYEAPGARLSALGLSAAGTDLGGLAFAWDPGDDWKRGRSVQPAAATATTTLTARQGARWEPDGGQRLGKATLAPNLRRADLGIWTLTYGQGDELHPARPGPPRDHSLHHRSGRPARDPHPRGRRRHRPHLRPRRPANR